MSTLVCAYPVPERIEDALLQAVTLAPMRDDPSCWHTLDDTVLVVESDRDAVYLMLLADEPPCSRDGSSILGARELWVPQARRDEFETAVRAQCVGRHAWCRVLRVTFDDPLQVEPFSEAMVEITGIPFGPGPDGLHHHDTSALFSS